MGIKKIYLYMLRIGISLITAPHELRKFRVNNWCVRRGVKSSRFICGFTLIELLLAMAIIGILVSISFSSYKVYMDRKDITLAKADLIGIASCIERFYIASGQYPISLNEGGCGRDDPWGTPYQYLNISTVKGKGKLRKDKSLNPINTFFDLYSMGKDGKSTSPLTAKSSRDDIIFANDGGFIGLATDF